MARGKVWLLALAAGLMACRPAGPRPVPRGEEHHLFLADARGGVGRFLPVDLSRFPLKFGSVIEVPGAAVAGKADAPEPIAAHHGAELFAVVEEGGAARVVRVRPDGTLQPLPASEKVLASRLEPRPLRLVGSRLFLVAADAILSARLDDAQHRLEPLDAAGFDHFSTLTSELVTAHDLRAGDPFDWQLLRLQESGSLVPAGRLAGALLADVVAVDGEGAADGLLFVAGQRNLRSVVARRGQRISEVDASRELSEAGATPAVPRSIAVLGLDLLLCRGRLEAVRLPLDAASAVREVDLAPCQGLARRGNAVWALVGKGPQELLRLEPGAGREARVVARYPLPRPDAFRALLP